MGWLLPSDSLSTTPFALAAQNYGDEFPRLGFERKVDPPKNETGRIVDAAGVGEFRLSAADRF